MGFLSTLTVMLAIAMSLLTLADAFVVPPCNVDLVASRSLSSSALQAMYNKKQRRDPNRASKNWSTRHGIGKDWEGRWERRYHELKAEMGWTDEKPFSISYVTNPRLWLWLHIQKENWRRGALRQDRCDKLSALGFVTPQGQVNNYYDVERSPPPTKAFHSTNGEWFPPTAPPVVQYKAFE